MSKPIIKVENLSKSYLIGHQSNEKYTALRDVLTNSAKGFIRNAGKMFRGEQLMGNDKVEEFFALKDINFEINQGDRVGIIGRNGAGKSTLLKVLSRITEPTSGRISINGRVASLLEVGTGFHPELSGRENIYLNGAILGMSRVEVKQKFDEIVAFAEVEKFLDTPVKRYSSGMYVRLAFAVAAHLEPEILIVDEVLAVGDAKFQQKCLGKMEDVSKEGRTVIFVSHNMAIISQLCNIGLLLNSGSLTYNGRIDNVINSYNSFNNNLSSKYNSNKVDSIDIQKIGVYQGNKGNIFTSDKELEIKFELNLLEKISGLHIGVAVNDKWKRKLFSTQFDLLDYNKGSVIKKMTVPNNVFVKGDYSLDCSLFIPMSTTYKYLSDICHFKIEDYHSNMAIYSNSDIGTVNINCLWE